MRRCLPAFATLVALAAPASTAMAQVLTPPPRSEPAPSAPQAPRQSQAEQSLIFDVSFFAGYDDNINPSGDGLSSDPLAPARSGVTGSSTGELEYRYRKESRTLEASGRVDMNSFRNLGVETLYGGEVYARAATAIGSKLTLSGRLGAQYRPTFLFLPESGAEPAAETIPVAAADPTSGIAEQSWRSSDTSAALAYEWSSRQNTTLAYGYSRNRVSGGTVINTRYHNASLSHLWEVTRGAGLTLDYQFTTHESETLLEPVQPVDSHAALAGFQIEKRLSPTRSITVRAGAGAMQVESEPGAEAPLDYISPSYSGGARMDLGRTWSLSADANRNISLIPGLTQQSFVNDTFSLGMGGEIGRRTLLAANASYTEGRPHEGQVGSFDALSATLQLQYDYARCCTLIGSYSYYQHQIRDLEAIPAGFPNDFDRNAFRVGTAIQLPLFGSAPRRPNRGGGRIPSRGR